MSTMTEGLPLTHETEVTAKARRRRFSAAEKLRVLREADRCTRPGELSALLRREPAVWINPPKARVDGEEVENATTPESNPNAIGAVRSSFEADLGHERPGILSRSFSSFAREESAGRAAGCRAARARTTLPPARSVSACRANAVGAKRSGEGAELRGLRRATQLARPSLAAHSAALNHLLLVRSSEQRPLQLKGLSR
jgi:hypothetical protein